MKKDIHPQYTIIKASCACGHIFKVGSTLDKIEVEVCSNCHPFYTGEEKIIDTAGRVEKFKTRRKAGEQAKVEADKKEKIKTTAETKKKKEEEDTKEKEVKKKTVKKKAKTNKASIALNDAVVDKPNQTPADLEEKKATPKK